MLDTLSSATAVAAATTAETDTNTNTNTTGDGLRSSLVKRRSAPAGLSCDDDDLEKLHHLGNDDDDDDDDDARYQHDHENANAMNVMIKMYTNHNTNNSSKSKSIFMASSYSPTTRSKGNQTTTFSSPDDHHHHQPLLLSPTSKSDHATPTSTMTTTAAPVLSPAERLKQIQEQQHQRQLVQNTIRDQEQRSGSLRKGIQVHMDRALARYQSQNNVGACLALKRMKQLQSEHAQVTKSIGFLKILQQKLLKLQASGSSSSSSPLQLQQSMRGGKQRIKVDSIGSRKGKGDGFFQDFGGGAPLSPPLTNGAVVDSSSHSNSIHKGLNHKNSPKHHSSPDLQTLLANQQHQQQQQPQSETATRSFGGLLKKSAKIGKAKPLPTTEGPDNSPGLRRRRSRLGARLRGIGRSKSPSPLSAYNNNNNNHDDHHDAQSHNSSHNHDDDFTETNAEEENTVVSAATTEDDPNKNANNNKPVSPRRRDSKSHQSSISNNNNSSAGGYTTTTQWVESQIQQILREQKRYLGQEDEPDGGVGGSHDRRDTSSNHSIGDDELEQELLLQELASLAKTAAETNHRSSEHSSNHDLQ